MSFDINYITGNPAVKEHWTKRALAFIIDLILILVIYFIVCNIFLIVTANTGDASATGEDELEGIDPNAFFVYDPDLVWMMYLMTVVSLIVMILLFAVMEASFGGSLGKRMAGLEVRAVRDTMTYQKAVLRNISKFAGVLIGGPYSLGPLALMVIIFAVIDTLLGTGEVPDPRMKYMDNIAGTTVVRTDIEEDIETLTYVPPPPPEYVPGPPEPPEPPGVSITTDIEDTGPGTGLSDPERDTVKQYMEFFGISEVRAVNLYVAGYKKLDDFKDAIPEDLLIVDKINPTVARHIIQRMSSA
jgi:uncharacterized RDD family membrane protein YckC